MGINAVSITDILQSKALVAVGAHTGHQLLVGFILQKRTCKPHIDVGEACALIMLSYANSAAQPDHGIAIP